MKLINYLGSLCISMSVVVSQSSDVFKLDFKIRRGEHRNEIGSNYVEKNDGKPFLSKRDGGKYLDMEILNKKTFYLTELKFGSEKEQVGVLVDTGSSDLWVMSSDLVCRADQYAKRDVRVLNHIQGNSNEVLEREPLKKPHLKEQTITLSEGSEPGIGGSIGTSTEAQAASGCTAYGTFNTDKSDSFKLNDTAPDFAISYADNTGAYGVWAHDNVVVGLTTVKSLSFAVVNETNSNVGVLGVGLSGLETTFSSARSFRRAYTYENLPIKLRNQGVIRKAAYSLYLGKEKDKSGSLLFGAVDHAKYSGDLMTLPVVNTLKSSGYDKAIRLQVVASGVSFNKSGKLLTLSSSNHAALLDSGTTLSYFPGQLLENLATTLDARYSNVLGAYLVTCIDDDSYQLALDFSGVKIEVPLSQVMLKYIGDTCYLGILNLTEMLLGDNILRSAYIVYDLDDFEISLAQARYTNDEDIEVISSSVPNAKRAPGFSSTSVASGSESDETTATSVAISLSPSSTSTSSSSSGGKSSKASSLSVFTLTYIFIAFVSGITFTVLL